MSLLEIKNLTKSFDEKIVIDSLSLSLPERGIVAVMGPSGCGKTTLLRMIAGLEKADGGEIIGLPKSCSYVFQEPRLFPWLSAKDNIALVCDNEKAALDWLARVELSDAADKLPSELSGGMEQRVSFARALSYNAELYILDEPFTGLDEALKTRLFSLVKEKAESSLVLIVTHDKSEADSLADEIIIFEGAPLKSYQQTKNRE